MEKEKKQKSFDLLVVIGFVVLVAVGVYFVFIRDNHNYYKEKSDSYIKDLELARINLKTNLDVRKFNPTILPSITDNKEFKYSGTRIVVSLNKETAVVKCIADGKTISNKYDGVKKVFYYNDNDCSWRLDVYVVTASKVYVMKIDASDIQSSNYNNIFKEYSNVYNYVDIYYDILRGLTCGQLELILGRNANGEYYDFYGNMKYDDGIYHYYENKNNYIKSNRQYKLNTLSGKVKVMGYDGVVDSLIYFIDENDYLYGFDVETDVYKKLSDKKVTNILNENKNEKRMVKFADGSTLEITFGLMEY